MSDFATLCLPLRPALLVKALFLCRCPSAAEDLVQDTLVAALASWDRFDAAGEDPSERARNWLTKMLVNRFIQDFRLRNRRKVLTEAHIEDFYPEPPQEALAGREHLVEHVDDDLKQAIESLPESYRDVVLRIAWGQDDRQIATELGLRRGNVRHRLWRARRRILATLGN
jgi:RNA polymerase sigma-70 factor (ECF subfamily)